MAIYKTEFSLSGNDWNLWTQILLRTYLGDLFEPKEILTNKWCKFLYRF